MQGDGLDPSEDDVLGDLYAEALEAGDEDVGLRHLLHGLVPKHVQLTRVQRLVNVATAGRTVGTVGRGLE